MNRLYLRNRERRTWRAYQARGYGNCDTEHWNTH